MAVKIEWTEPVFQDMEAIVSYIESEWSENVADGFLELIKERVQTCLNILLWKWLREGTLQYEV